MARRKNASGKRPLKALLRPPFDQLIPEELREAEDIQIRGIATDGESVSSVTFALAFPAILTAHVSTEEEGGYSAEIPALPGCITEAETLEELRENLREAAQAWLDATTELAPDNPFRIAVGTTERR